MRGFLVIALGLLVPALGFAKKSVGLVEVDGAIGPATADYIVRAIALAERSEHQCLIIQLDTPGGLLDSTKTIVESFFASRVPVVVYVAPPGSSAGSAGCFITLAANVAVMAPSTTIGAAHPVEIGGSPMGGESKTDDTMKQKLENYSVSFIESIANRRHRNAEWAKSSVKDSAAITSEKALELKVIDFLAKDIPELLQLIDGREVDGRKLQTAGAELVSIPMSIRESLFQLLWRPEVMFILMLIAIYGIIGELSNPGAILPGVAGGIALLLALYMSAILPVNVTGIALIILALALFIVDIFAPTHGVLTGGGVISFFLGAVMLFDNAGPGFELPLGLIIPATLATAAFFIFVAGAGLKAQQLPVRAGRETMLGKVVPALSRIDSAGAGRVFIEGELWNAKSEEIIDPGQLAEITGFEGLTLIVKPQSKP